MNIKGSFPVTGQHDTFLGKVNIKGAAQKKQNENSQAQQQKTEKETTAQKILNQQLSVLEQLKEMQENERKNRKLNAITDKINNGEDLSPEELRYLQEKNPQLYMEVKSEMMIGKQFEERLKHCKTKEEAKDAYIMEIQMVQNACGIKGGTGVKPNYAKYNRLIKRIEKVWEKYKKGTLGKEEKQIKSK